MNVEMENKTENTAKSIADLAEDARGKVGYEFFLERFQFVNETLLEAYAQKKALIDLAVKEGFASQPLIKQNDDGTWTRVTISDNAERINDGYCEFVKVERFSVKIDTLKNKPKELK